MKIISIREIEMCEAIKRGESGSLEADDYYPAIKLYRSTADLYQTLVSLESQQLLINNHPSLVKKEDDIVDDKKEDDKRLLRLMIDED